MDILVDDDELIWARFPCTCSSANHALDVVIYKGISGDGGMCSSEVEFTVTSHPQSLWQSLKWALRCLRTRNFEDTDMSIRRTDAHALASLLSGPDTASN